LIAWKLSKGELGLSGQRQKVLEVKSLGALFKLLSVNYVGSFNNVSPKKGFIYYVCGIYVFCVLK